MLPGVTSDLLRGENVFCIIYCVSASMDAAVTLGEIRYHQNKKSLEPSKRDLVKSGLIASEKEEMMPTPNW